MTGDAFPVELHLRRRLLVTGGAAELCVCAGEREAGLFAVVEFPQAPAIRGVALLTFLAEASLVNIRVFVALAARGLRYPESLSRMALFAGNCNVQAEKREFRQIVIEVDHRLPALWQMAVIARSAQPGAVNVARPMTAHAVCWQLPRTERRRVASVAIHAGVFAGKLPASIARVVERGRPPLLRSVATGAVRSHAPRMNVLALVAADTLLRQLVMQIPRTVAVLTVQASVRVFQRKSSFPGVIEAGGFPAAGGMTTGTFRTALPAMHVVRRMAGDALRWRPLVAIPEMTLDASDGLVFIVQWKARLAVIECHVLPYLRVVAGSAIPPQLALVRLLSLVTDGAFVRSIAKGFAGLMTAAARQINVCTLQREIRDVVIELLAAEFHDVGSTTLVLHVTRTALRGFDSLQAAVKPTVRGDVRRDGLVTVETQLPLTATVAAIMTIRALLLQLLMGRGQLARHEEFFRVHGITAFRWENT
jgi:hypothetical protein